MVAAILHLQKGARPSFEMIDHLGRGFAHAHDVVDPHPLGRILAEIGVSRGSEFFLIAQHGIDFRHGGICVRLGLGGAAGDDDAGAWMLAPQLADRLARLAHGFGGHGAGVDHHGVLQLRLARTRLDRLAFIGVEAAAESDDVNGHRHPDRAGPGTPWFPAPSSTYGCRSAAIPAAICRHRVPLPLCGR